MANIFSTTTALEPRLVGTVFTSATVSLMSTCIYDAEQEIKKQLSKTYDLSTVYFTAAASTPPILKTLCENLAQGYYYEQTARGSKESFARADRFITRAMENLKSLACGETQLFDSAGALIDPSGQQWQVKATEAYPTTFNEDKPRNWRPSSDKLDDISDERD